MRISDWSSDVCSSDLSARRRRGRQSPPERRDSRRWHRASPLRPRDIVVDILCEDVERDVAAFDDDIVEIAQVVAVAERRLGAAALADELAVAELVPARLAGPAAITVDLARHLQRVRPVALDEEATRLLARPALGLRSEEHTSELQSLM